MIGRVVLVVAVLVAASLAAGACAGDGGDSGEDEATPTTEPSAAPTTSAQPPPGSEVEAPPFRGDPDSPFCRSLEELGPVADPFEPDIEPREVELRLRALRLRTEDALAVAPAELTDDIAAVVDALQDLDEALEPFDHDLAAAGEAGVDLSFTNDPAFSSSAVRIGAYREQVCG